MARSTASIMPRLGDRPGARTFVVIGHGRSPEGMGWGPRINAADFVVRMWNWHWQAPQDYGTKYDWGVLEVHKQIMQQWKECNRHQPAQGWLASLLLRYRDMVGDLPPDTVLINQEVYLRQPRRRDWGLGETGVWQLTRGGVAACWAIDNASKEGDTVVLVGFDVIKAGIAAPVAEAFSPEYMASAGFFGMGCYVPGKTKEGNHDYPAERNLLHFLAERHAVNLVFAEDIWPSSTS